MAKNYITLVAIKFKSEGGDTDETNFIESVTVNVATKDSNGSWTNVDIPTNQFKIFLNTEELNSVNNYDIIPSTTELGNYLIRFKGALPKASDYLIVTAENGVDSFNRLFIDFVVYLDNNGVGEIPSFTVKNPGQYKFVLNNVDGITLNKVSDEVYNFINEPFKDNCSITPLNLTTYPPNLIPPGGFNVKIKVTLKDKDNKPITGNNQISMFAQLLLPAPPERKLLN